MQSVQHTHKKIHSHVKIKPFLWAYRKSNNIANKKVFWDVTPYSLVARLISNEPHNATMHETKLY